jgi:hypothetical protein
MTMTTESEEADENVLVVYCCRQGVNKNHNTIHNTHMRRYFFSRNKSRRKVKVLIVLIFHISYLM